MAQAMSLAGSSIRIASWNIRSLNSKRPELEMYLRQSGTGVLALQETHRPEGGWPLRIRGFQCYERPADTGVRGINGLALCVRDQISAYELGEGVTPFTLAIKVTLPDGTEWYVVNVYIPPRGTGNRTQAIAAVKQLAQRIIGRDLGARLLLLGDWNMHGQQLGRMLARWRLPLHIQTCNGSSKTFQGARTWSDIDHMVVSAEAGRSMMRVRVDRSWDLSDHWPIEGYIHVEASGGTEATPGTATTDSAPRRGPGLQSDRPMRFQPRLVNENREAIANHNMWEVLLADDEADDSSVDDTRDRAQTYISRPTANRDEQQTTDQLVDRFEEVLRVVGESTGTLMDEHGDVRTSNVRNTYRLSQTAKRAIERRRRAHLQWVNREGPQRGGMLWAIYQEQKRAAKVAVRQSMQRSWLVYVSQGAAKLSDHQLREFWMWTRTITGRSRDGRRDASNVLIDPESGRLIAEPQHRLALWARHYRQLSEDPTGHSRDPRYWEQQFPERHEVEVLPRMNELIEWEELNSALIHLKNWKAPGLDGIPAEVLKTAISDATEQDPMTPNTGLGKVLLRLANRVLSEGVIPARWKTAAVVSVPKKGDLRVMDNYRGISLLPVVLKLITVVVIRRVERGLESRGWFRREQAGFRSLEECVGQATALYETLQRRRHAGLATYVAFIDLRKAYDTVPHWAMLRKLWLAGVRGRVFEFMRNLYEDVHMVVRTPHGHSTPVQLLRGVRQGCPGSPTEFNIFVNDILDGLDPWGVLVPGLGDQRIAGLLFADDLVVLAPTRQRLVRMLSHLDTWAATNEMRFGVNKCGVMAIERLDDLAGRKMTALRREPERWVLGGQQVPIVDSYQYLGLVFTPSLGMDMLVADRVSKGLKAYFGLKAVLECQKIPVTIRIRLLKAMLVPVLTYGGELWGMSGERAAAAQRVLNRALRSLVRLGDRSSLTSTATLGVELGVPPIASMTAAARARAYVKYPTVRTVVSLLARNPPVRSGRRQTWLTGSRMWLRRYSPEVIAGVEDRQDPEMLALAPSTVARQVRQIVWTRTNRASGGQGLQRYMSCAFDETRDYIGEAVRFPADAMGVHWLLRARVDSIWTGHQYARIRWLPEEYKVRCPFCDVGHHGETLSHMLVACPRWQESRQVLLQTMIDEARQHLEVDPVRVNAHDHDTSDAIDVDAGDDDNGDIDIKGIAAYLLGGRCGGNRCAYWVRNPVPDTVVPGDPQERLGVVAHTVMEATENTAAMVPGFIRVARFLSVVIPARQAVLGLLLQPPRADANHGRAALVEDENGYDGSGT